MHWRRPESAAILLALLLCAVAPAPPDTRPDLYFLVHGDKLGENLARLGPAIAAAMSCGRYARVHVIGNIAEMIPVQESATGTRYVPHRLRNPLGSTDDAIPYPDSYEAPKDGRSHAEDIVRAVTWLRENRLTDAAAVLDFMRGPRFARECRNDSVLRIARVLAEYESHLGPSPYSSGMPASMLRRESTRMIRQYFRFADHREELVPLLAAMRRGDVLVEDANPMTGINFEPVLQPHRDRGVAVVPYHTANSGPESRGPTTIEQDSLTRAAALEHPDTKERVLGTEPLTFGAWQRLLTAPLSADDERRYEARLAEAVGGPRSALPFELLNLRASFQRETLVGGARHFEALLRARLAASPPVNLLIAPFGAPDVPELQAVVERLKREFPTRFFEAATPEMQDEGFLRFLLGRASRFLTPDTGAAWLGVGGWPEKTHVVLFTEGPTTLQAQRAERWGQNWWSERAVYHLVNTTGPRSQAEAVSENISSRRATASAPCDSLFDGWVAGS